MGHRMDAETGSYRVTGSDAKLIVTRVGETWQFYAFVYAAAITIALTLIDEISDRHWPWRLGAKIVATAALTYFLLFNVTVRTWLANRLPRFKEEHR